MTVLLLLLIIYIFIGIWLFLLPVKFLRVNRCDTIIDIPNIYIYSFQFHIHTQFSYDSLGKLEDIKKAKEECGIDFVVISDHRNKDVAQHVAGDFIVGEEKRVEEGDIIDLGEVKVIAHPFNPKYIWRGKVDKGTPLEVINVKDVLKKNKLGVILSLFSYILFYPVLRKNLPYYLRRLINIEYYIKKIIEKNWFIKTVGGLDHHVKLYYVDSKKKFLFPDYSFSFKIFRNYIFSEKPIKSEKDFINALKEGKTVLVFDEKPFIIWVENKRINIYSLRKNIIWFIRSYRGNKTYCCNGNISPELEEGSYIIYGYTYRFKFFKIYFGLMPYFVSSSLEVESGRNTSATRG